MTFEREKIAAHAQDLADKVKSNLQMSLTSKGIELIEAAGEIVAPHTVSLVGTGETKTAKDIILAPGSVPFVPPGVQVNL